MNCEKKTYDVILFDLDGTVTDPGEGITNAVIYALKKFGIEVEERSQLYKFIGPPLVDSFREFYGMNKEDCDKAVRYYREYYSETGLFENELYEGVEDLLKKLKEMGKTIGLATSKPEHFAVRILEYFHIDSYFDFIGGSAADGTRLRKEEVVAYVLEQLKVRDLEKVLMIGDREFDVFGAQKNGIDSLGVLYGYGCEEEFKSAKATYIAEKIENILQFI